MNVFCIWIVTGSDELGTRWRNALHGQGWPAERLHTFEDLKGRTTHLNPGLAIVDKRCFSCRTGNSAAGELAKFHDTCPRISVVVFSNPGNVTNKEIAAYLEAGADDFILDSIDERVFVAKLKSHLRRLLPSLASMLNVLETSGRTFRADRAKRIVWVKNSHGSYVEVNGLTPKEFQLMCLFIEHDGSAIERSYIMEHVWKDRAADVNMEAVDKHVESIRKKLGSHGRKIRTVYGMGYKLEK